MSPVSSPDVVVIGAGIVGAACAYALTGAGLSVTVIDRGGVSGGTTGAGEGNILVSDKPVGPELALVQASRELWLAWAAALGADRIELEAKGGLTVAATVDGRAAMEELAAAQREAGVTATPVEPAELPDYEPHLAGGLAGAMFYPEDLQVQPAKAAAHLLRVARDRGARLRLGTAVTGIATAPGDGRAVAVGTTAGPVPAGAVVNAAGTWAANVAALAHVELPIAPRRGFILVTEPLPDTVVRHKVYAAEYVSNVVSDAAGLETSAVVEGTRAGTVLIGASRERAGFDRLFPLEVLRRLAAQAVALFPVLADVRAIRAYRGFRPYSPDHLPVIGPDPRVPGLYHACGHEGAGIGLAPATGALVAAALTGATPPVDPKPFLPERFS